jgi:hypothetical protein
MVFIKQIISWQTLKLIDLYIEPIMKGTAQYCFKIGCFCKKENIVIVLKAADMI